jgi:hypothetical protein
MGVAAMLITEASVVDVILSAECISRAFALGQTADSPTRFVTENQG